MASKDNSSVSNPTWIYPKYDPALLSSIIKELHLHPVAAQTFISRGFQTVDEVRDFLYVHLSNLHDPELLLDMSKAVQRLLLAKERGEHVMVYGDSDVDGITGVALLVEFLRSIEMKVSYCFLGAFLKHYGEPSLLIAKMKEEGVTLLITVDCGITAGKEVSDINKQGIDVIVTDHHMPTGKIPHCIATLNPKLRDHTYPNKDLTGVGVAFKLARGVVNALQKNNPKLKLDIKHLLDLVTLGTVTDVGTLLGENRTMVRHGIKEIAKGSRLGLHKLCIFSGVNPSEVTSTDIVLKISPKLNSLGRLADASKGVELLLTKDPEVADDIIQYLDKINRERQKIEADVFHDVQKILKNQPDIVKQAAIVLSSQDWHSRVIPIISARLAKAYNKPVAIISNQGGVGKGSLRTIGSFPLLGILQKCSPMFISYGGHDFAAGIIINEDQIEAFRKKFIHLVNSSLKKEKAVVTLPLDARADFDEIDHDLLSSIDLFEPFGKGNPVPIFYTIVHQVRYPKLLPGNHLKLYLNYGERNLEGIAFGLGDRIGALKASWNQPLELAYTPRLSQSANGGVIHLLVRDFHILPLNYKDTTAKF
ncbi:single-stranded-DNA-specific exonuclease RecJ [Chlamydia psittaci]|uniref:Single-stranded-DNA-specific exonuclease RecJ n=1 Tax=Chlamydophila parapsittaci TaxID=344886 RepID=A0ABX5VZF6_9CHLA|nr:MULTISPECIES: single-stranded-DNA-specific exonuclease RecJ [Chlamydia]AFS20295.1 single-stranded-DNA-specific exonuclease RecJ [Chlamydia psittaci GR9]AFS23402.1 single-stranded-DNA-specific exonuclease RecJ [Chlamydia psittaci WS/RT/E30]QDE37380.1 single-stranded-DNA-specific exonuclease RecJ [Chlamydophila parapsittaci]QHE19042.1 single-stranded-DNA-specific exonuclease RecJ [Chlamydia psittaci]UWF54867.1 single-stranded-DNA-specific exonuclease RecJ [Chlamydia psittaci]